MVIGMKNTNLNIFVVLVCCLGYNQIRILKMSWVNKMKIKWETETINKLYWIQSNNRNYALKNSKWSYWIDSTSFLTHSQTVRATNI